jgi:hypothetical protein
MARSANSGWMKVLGASGALLALAVVLAVWAWRPGVPPLVHPRAADDALPVMADPVSFADTLSQLSRPLLVGLGVPERVIRIDRTPEELGSTVRWELKSDVPGALPLAVCNLELSRLARRLGGEVISATEDRTGRRLSMRIGMKGSGTNLVTLTSNPKLPRGTGRIAVIVDDFGYQDRGLIEGFYQLKQTVTLSIFPGQEQTAHTAMKAHEHGHGIMVHLPMEPIDYPRRDPGEGAIFVDASGEEIHRLTRSALASVPLATGVNNHMGSRATQDERVMRAVLEETRSLGFFFVDSRTSAQSVAFDTAQSMGIRSARNDRFLDLKEEDASIERALRALAKEARIRGTAIGIGHAKRVTLQVLKRVLPELEREGFTFVRADEAVR